ncbi:carbohydrate ABC transporter permease [Clostridium fallax]|uniref:Carbohydrate ABC transporter membrane protein 2, CUT1 family n=1 Tax=Clostridium fallax TaxID=1533 RepID=A0A1M4XVS0_9CLOT|nr:carbohydrate ABC transporter permease [Clostridium fallax]SHE97446.1 carbohydrate ABC transporter membrane protein 2, CUT1 family [Clostridium fallax]SQB06516.1 binding-protein-dependent transport system inner membrane protein [Clostridium fallax]
MKEKFSEKTIYYIATLIFIIFTLGPIIWCFIISITPENEMLKETASLLPSSITLGNYKEILNPSTQSHVILFNGIKNSLTISVITLLIGIPISVITGFTFSKYRFKGRNFMMKFILITTVIPVFTTIIPIYGIFSEYNMLDSLFWISVIYVSSFIPMNTWIMMTYFNSIPKGIWEAAEVDGCNEREAFFKVILPVSTPIIFACMLIMFLMSWNQFQIPLILTSSQENKVVTLIMSEFMSRDSISYGMIATCGIFSIIPPTIIAILFRKLLISGLTSGSVKG